ncbi:MAG: hypothetical protein JNM72_14065 [Deltaproteobacteria bacterium]|nr:hypothetical protein [Deltaproteobacteria bacterium]
MLTRRAPCAPALALALAASTAQAGPRAPAPDAGGLSASAAEIPALSALLEKAQWQPTPELSGIFLPGQIFEVTPLGHRSLAEGCVAKRPSSFTYTAADIVTSLQAGVRVGGPLASARGSGELVKKIKFGAPNQLTIPRLDLVLTTDCKARLGALPQDQLYRSYVVQEVLMAEIAEQTCGRVDASGRLVGFGSADVELAAACSQASLEPVAVGYRTVPLAELMGLPAAVAAAPAEAPPPQAAPPKAAAPKPAPAAPRPAARGGAPCAGPAG